MLNKSWAEILSVFDNLLATVRENQVPRVLVQVGHAGGGGHEHWGSVRGGW